MSKKVIKILCIALATVFLALVVYGIVYASGEISRLSNSGIGIIGGASRGTFLFYFFSFFKSSPLISISAIASLVGSTVLGILLLLKKK